MSSVTNPYLNFLPSHRKKTGSSTTDDSHKPHQHHQTSRRTKFNLLLLFLLTNLLSIYFSISLPDLFDTTDSISRQLNSTQSKLSLTQTQLASSHRRLTETNALLETLLTELNKKKSTTSNSSPPPPIDIELQGWQHDLLSPELKLAVGPHKLPFGFTPNIGSDALHPPLGSACGHYQDEVEQYMTYRVGGECPPDDVFAQRLMLKGCEPLPRRRCHPKSPKNYAGPTPLPASLWSTPPDTSVAWEPYTCKDYRCLVRRNSAKGFFDCKDCFDLKGKEAHRWTQDFGELDYGIDTVLGLKPKGTVRIGLDIGGGTGTFAARMRERDVTVVTSTMNFNGPFNSFIASRGLVPVHVSVAHRLPFFDNTLDIVHSMHVLSNWIPDAVLEFALYDIYRVLRPGGIFWLDHFFCVGGQLNVTYVPMFGRIGFEKLRWNAGRKLDRGVEMNEWYISALLEKPMT